MTETTENKTYSFSGFELDTERRTLTKNNEKITLNSKTFDLLLALVARRGEVLSKDCLLETVWAGQFVEENNLTVHISALRKALGERKDAHKFIVTIPGRGYRFVADVIENAAENAEILLENHTISRIVIEEEIENDQCSDDPPQKTASDAKILDQNRIDKIAAPARARTLLDWLRTNPVLTAVVIGGALMLAAIGGSGFNSWRRERVAAFQTVVPFAETNIKQLTTNGRISIAALSPDGKLFAYVVNELGNRSLWLGYTEGGNDIQLRPPMEAVYGELAFSPDSNRLFYSLRDDSNSLPTLYELPVFGGAPEKVAENVNVFALAPDGKQIAFARDGERKNSIVVFNLENSQTREIVSLPFSIWFQPSSISWSPDGKRLAFAARRGESDVEQEIFSLNLADEKLEQITNKAFVEIIKTVWLADATGLLMTTLDPANRWASVPQYQIWHVSLADGAARRVTSDLSSYANSLSLSADSKRILAIEHRQLNNVWVAPVGDLSAAKQITFSSFSRYDGLWGLDWTPDGRIVYTSSDAQSQIISSMDADGKNARQLTAPGFVDSALHVSNDGRYIVFHSTRGGGGFDVWRMNADGGNPVRLTFDGKNYQPFVSADSRWVYYKAWKNKIGELRRVSIDGGEPEILNDKETSWGSFASDGKYFAALYKTDKSRLAIFAADTGTPLRQFDLPKTGTLYMGSRWTPDGQAVVFRDGNFGYWKQNIAGGAPERLAGLPREKLYNFAFSKNGESFAFVRGTEIRDVVLIQNK
jgi:Tol biopolymer transport system component/DNA-binding winged helix-turn-helix (wHTH) protein